MNNYRDLNKVVEEALELHSSYELPEFKLPKEKTLVIASGNAFPTGKIIFENQDAIFADEGKYKEIIENNNSIKSVTVISASGEKHAPIIIRDLIDKKLDTHLITCNKESSAAKLLTEDKIIETKSNEEPITYNTSTYLGMILAKTKEDPKKIRRHINYIKENMPKNLGEYKSYYMMIPPKFDIIREMFVTKFDELFGGIVNGRCYTTEQTRHAKTVIPSKEELFISIGFENNLFGTEESRWNIPLFEGANYASLISIGYFIVGNIQEQKEAYFENNYKEYKKIQTEQIFNKEIYNNTMKKFNI